ncbi:MAG: glutathione S-transferase family protein [Oculatellaceae cyanobacterium Prado106]|jgi:glutathione S-transferase|nr:glutathione S-transferase family protein [Oculatellaceae cyanobacterium Prado106]
MYTLHIANKLYSSWSLRPWVLMTELASPFTEVMHPLAEGSNWSDFRNFSPSGKVPCLHAQNQVIWDSLAIAEYLAEQHPEVWPQDTAARAWARCAAAEMHAGFGTLRHDCSMHCGLRVQLHQISAALQQDIDRVIELWTEGIERFGGSFLAGDRFTAVDAFFAPVAFRFQTYQIPLPEVANRYTQQLLTLESMQSWVTDALKEPWREPGHEQDVRSMGVVVEDLLSAEVDGRDR